MADGIRVDIKLDTTVLDRILAALPGGVELALDKIVTDINATAVNSMEGIKHGRVYTHGNVAHQASAPGEPPAVDTGNLKNSWYMRKTRGSRTFGFSAEYAPHLEFGTVRMAARPFFLPAIVKGSAGLVREITALARGEAVLAMWRRSG